MKKLFKILFASWSFCMWCLVVSVLASCLGGPGFDSQSGHGCFYLCLSSLCVNVAHSINKYLWQCGVDNVSHLPDLG